jgi:hypothetical protein
MNFVIDFDINQKLLFQVEITYIYSISVRLEIATNERLPHKCFHPLLVGDSDFSNGKSARILESRPAEECKGESSSILHVSGMSSSR